LVLGFYSCDFTQPKAIEVKGTPSVRFAETVDIGKLFIDLLDDAIVGGNDSDKLTIYKCDQTEDLTYLIHMDILSTDFDSIEHDSEFDNLKNYFPDMDIEAAHLNTYLGEDKTLISSGDSPIILPLSEIGSLLGNFNFTGYKTKLYFSGSSFIEKAKVNIKIEEVEGSNKAEHNAVPIENVSSGVNPKDEVKVYNGTDITSGGIDIDIPITGKDIAVSFQVYFPNGTKLTLSDFEAGNINVEIVFWLPFKFTTTEPTEIAFPEDAFFSSEDDLFEREEPGAKNKFTDIVESLSVNVKFQNNPFMNAELVIESKNIEIKNAIQSNMLSFTLTEEDIKSINDPDNWPFTPRIKIRFPAGAELHFPRVFNVTEFGFKAKIRYRVDL